MSKDFDDMDLDLEEEDEKVEEKPKAKPAIKSKTPAQVKGSTQTKTPASAAADTGKRVNVFFKSTVGPERTEKLSIGTRTPVSDVKNTLANIFGLAPDDFHLSHAGRTMDENAPVGDYNVDNGDEILLIPHSTAG